MDNLDLNTIQKQLRPVEIMGEDVSFKLEIERMRKMWLTMIEQSILDIIHPPKHKRAKTNYKRSYAWIFGGEPDFEEICHLVDICPNNIRKSIEKVLKFYRKIQ